MQRFALLVGSVVLVILVIPAKDLPHAQGHYETIDRPHPKDIVNLRVPVSLAPGESTTIYGVPANAWFVMKYHGQSSGSEHIAILEDINGTQTVKLAHGDNKYTDTIADSPGRTFRPGSAVIVKSLYPFDITPTILVDGYLVRGP